MGLLSPRGAAGFKQGGIVFLPLETAEYLFSKTGNVNTISVVVADGADENAVTEALRARLPKGLIVRSPTERSQLSKETVEKVQKGLDFAYVMILALAFFTILNTFLMNVGERRRQLAVLRAIGATRRQIIYMLLLEGLSMGVVGTVLGTAAGVGGAMSAYAVDGPGLFHRHARPADYPRPVRFRRHPWPERLAAGHVRSGVDRGPGVAAGRNAVHRLRRAQPRVGDLRSRGGHGLYRHRLGHGGLHQRLSARADADRAGHDLHRGLPAVGADDVGSAGVVGGGRAASAAAAPKAGSPTARSFAAASAPP